MLKNHNHHPPKTCLKLLQWLVKEDLLEEILGDLEEKYAKVLTKKSPRAAQLNYYYQTLHYLRPFALKKPIADGFNPTFMLGNYFKIALRNLSKNTIFSFIHILGLAIGTAACLLILQYVQFERSYDNFHEKAANIYRVPIEYSKGFSVFSKTAANHPGLGPAMQEEFPEVDAFVRMLHPSNVGANFALTYEKENGQKVTSTEDGMYLADSTFFNIFSFPLLEGNPQMALAKPGSIVLSATMAKKYFGNENPLNKIIKVNGRGEFTVTGVYRDLPANSHLQFDALISFNTFFRGLPEKSAWIWPEFYTYLLLKPNADTKAMEARFPAFTERHMAAIHKEHNFQTYFSLQPLRDIHLKSECANEITPSGNEKTIYFLSILALFILIIAWGNYINLSTSKAIERAKEVGVRKVVGANKSQLIGQFLTESFLLNGLGILLGLFLAGIFLPQFTTIIGKDIGNSLLNFGLIMNPIFWLLFFVAIAFGGLIAGFYPAIILSSFRPVQVLKGYFHRSQQTTFFRKALVGFQFVLSIILIAATLLITQQLSFMGKKELGYNKDQILVIKAPIIRDSTYGQRVDALKSELLQFPVISNFTSSSEVPGKLIAFRSEGRLEGQEKEANNSMYLKSIDDTYFSTFEIPLIAGRFFSNTDRANPYNEETINKVLINEKMLDNYGFKTATEAIGKNVLFKLGPNDRRGKIIGVVKNYHQRSVKEVYEPILYYYPSFDNWKYFSLNLNSTNWNETIALVEDKYKATFANNAFEYFFLDEFFDRQYRSEQQFSQVCRMIASLAIFVACLGLFGLSTLIMAQRSKEIGVRKILGATMPNLLLLITKDFVKMLVIANIVAIPIIFYFGKKWLDNFAFNVGLDWSLFVVPIITLLTIVFIIVGVQMYRTAVLNPIHALRDE